MYTDQQTKTSTHSHTHTLPIHTLTCHLCETEIEYFKTFLQALKLIFRRILEKTVDSYY